MRARCPHLDALASHVTEFAKILTRRPASRTGRLDRRRRGQPDQPELASFTTGIRRDYQAVLNGLTLPYSSGNVEGNVTGSRCSNGKCTAAPFDLLRKRILLAS